MKNVEMTVEGTMLTIKVDLSKEFGPSASGKTIIIASTEGNGNHSKPRGESRIERIPKEIDTVSLAAGNGSRWLVADAISSYLRSHTP